MVQDLNPINWGSQDRFQVHFIVKTYNNLSEEKFLAKSKLTTKGFFASKRIAGIEWIGGSLAVALNSDDELAAMITQLPYHDANIYIEPTKGGIRIHGNWKDSHDFAMRKDMFAVYDRIASHIKRELGSPPIQS